jgi:type VI secretion system protein ImpL
MKKWLIFAAICLGVLAICALIWFVFPLVAIADVRPFASVWLRLALVLLTLTIFSGVYALKYYRGRKASAALAAEIAKTEPSETDSDAKQLADKMADALKTLKTSSRAKGDFLYELPWYIIIGPPGAGKTTALLNSGLKFAVTGAKDRKPISGVGGTRYCDWWFTEDAVLIDTAGRYTTQDSDAGSDRKSWLSFLDLLKKNRPLQPINGVMIGISLADLMTLPEAELASHCIAVRKRLSELHDRLAVDFPVYVIFTKADLVNGFNEFFGSLGEQRRRMVWGATFKVKNKAENKVSEAGDEFDLLMDRLNQEMADRLQEEGDPLSRARIFGFPSQMAVVKPAVINFLNQIFEPTRYQTDIPLRGFYFTSGTQEGTPIDRLLGAMSGAFQNAAPQPAMSGRGKSYFLGDLLTKVIFGEAGWVSTNRSAQQRSRALAYAGYGAVALVTVAMLGLWGLSYFYNTQLISATDRGVIKYVQAAKDVLIEDPVSDTDFVKPMSLLDMLLYLPAGYATRDTPEEPVGTLGLSQKDTLLAASTVAYQTALDRMLRSRLVLYVEKQLEANQDNPIFLYEALKVYLMLGRYEGAPIDKELIVSWMSNQWDATQGAANVKARTEFLGHVENMLALDNGGGVDVPLNGPLVEQAQRIIARMSIADRAYLLLKSEASSEDGGDWNAVEAGGPETRTVFETQDGTELESVKVARFYTYFGFHELFLGKMNDVADQLEDERWVLGKLGEQTAITAQVKSLGPDLVQTYTADFIKAWTGALDKLRLKPLSADKADYAILDALTGPTSPLEGLLHSVSTQTKLTAEPAVPQSEEGNTAVDAATEVLKKKLQSKATGMARIGLDIARKSELRAGAAAPRSQLPGVEIENHFRAFHEMVDGELNQRPIDQLLDNLRGIRQNLIEAKADGESAASSAQVVAKFVLTLKTQNANRLPPPFDAMIQAAAQEFEGDAANATISELTAALKGSVTQKCELAVKNRFPFAPKSKREVPWQDFAAVFGQGGVLDEFFATKLESLVDQTGSDWVWKNTTRLGRELSPATLKSFQNAAKIRAAFFPQGGNVPNVILTITPGNFHEEATGAIFEINGTKLETTMVPESKDFNWPGGSLADGSASVTILPVLDDGISTIGEKGPWAFYKLIDRGSPKKRGDSILLNYVIGGRYVTYQVKVGSLANPFALPELQRFTCPKGF